MRRVGATFLFAVVCASFIACDDPQVASSGAKWERAASADATYWVDWRVVVGVIPKADPFDVEIRITNYKTGAPSNVQCSIDAEMPEHGHGMNVIPNMQQLGPGHFLAKGMLLHMPGRWSIVIDATDGAMTERAQFLYLMP